MFPTLDGLPPAVFAQTAERLGFESIWFPEHTHIPVLPLDDYPDFPDGGALPRYYSKTLDPFVALSAAACATSKIRLGFGVCLIIQRSPITTAKAVASLDQISGGRVMLGVGAGWNRAEMSNHGTDPKRRMGLMAERVKAMKAIWTLAEPEFHGKWVDFDPIWSDPKPRQRPHPPVFIAGMGPTVLDRVLDFGDGWMPEPVDGLLERVAELHERSTALGRAGEFPVTVVSADLDSLGDYETAGVTRCVHWVTADDPHAARADLSELAHRLELAGN